MHERIYLSRPSVNGRELNHIHRLLTDGCTNPTGTQIHTFEQRLSQYTNSKHVLAVASGTAAIHLAMMALNVEKGDIVLCQSLTFVASANPICYRGATPVFIDSEKDTWNICPDALEEAIKYYIQKGKKPRALIGVHMYGMPLRLEAVLDICARYEIPFIEDAAEALGSNYKGLSVGSFGKIGVLSFNMNKIITTSGGGALLTDDHLIYKKAHFLSTQAKDNAPFYQHSQVGYNYRMGDLNAAMGLAQMESIEESVNKRRSNFDFYKQTLQHLPGLSFQNGPDNCRSNRWLTAILIDPRESRGVDRETIRLELENENIESRPVWKPMHLQPLFKTAKYFGRKLSEELFTNGLCLPSGSDLGIADLKRVAECIVNCFVK